MHSPAPRLRDPILSCGLLTLAFLLLCLVRLGIPTKPYFDEVHYVPAARALIELSHPVNQEHPLLGKELIAAGMVIAGDGPIGWRIMSALFGCLALFAFMRAMWFATLSRFSALAGGLFMATGFFLFVQSRIAMLDIFMVSFCMIALWTLVAALRTEKHVRTRLAIAGAALGFALASKFNAAPVAMLPGIALLALRLFAAGPAFLTARSLRPYPGLNLLELSFWLGALPLLTYALSLGPAFFYQSNPLTIDTFISYHREILNLQHEVKTPHPYQSTWPLWVINWRAIWYLYEPVDGAMRGVLLIGNPLTMLAGLPALAWCAWAAMFRQRWDALAVVLLYLASLGMWWITDKPIQFFYHYFLPSCFLFAALALALDEWWKRRKYKVPLALTGIATAIFAFYYPILSAAPLAARDSFAQYTWLESWR